jgi:hypothetical protein
MAHATSAPCAVDACANGEALAHFRQLPLALCSRSLFFSGTSGPLRFSRSFRLGRASGPLRFGRSLRLGRASGPLGAVLRRERLDYEVVTGKI